jgi:hypothetical protein
VPGASRSARLYGPLVGHDLSEEGKGREFQRIAEQLRAEIADGIHPVASRLPPQRSLAGRFGVSRGTVQRPHRDACQLWSNFPMEQVGWW